MDKYGGANLGVPNGANITGTGRGVVFLAWGAWAAKRVAKVNKASGDLSAVTAHSYCSEQTKHLILKSAVRCLTTCVRATLTFIAS